MGHSVERVVPSQSAKVSRRINPRQTLRVERVEADHCGIAGHYADPWSGLHASRLPRSVSWGSEQVVEVTQWDPDPGGANAQLVPQLVDSLL